MLHGVESFEEGLLPADTLEEQDEDGESVRVAREKFTSFWRDYVQKAVVRNMLESGRVLDPAGTAGDVALSTESFKKYLQHCLERKPRLVALFASQNGKQDKEVHKYTLYCLLSVSGVEMAHNPVTVRRTVA